MCVLESIRPSPRKTRVYPGQLIDEPPCPPPNVRNSEVFDVQRPLPVFTVLLDVDEPRTILGQMLAHVGLYGLEPVDGMGLNPLLSSYFR